MDKPITYVYQGEEGGQTHFYKQDENHNLDSVIGIEESVHPDPFKFYLQYFHKKVGDKDIAIRNEIPNKLPEGLEAKNLNPLSPEQMMLIYAQIAMSE